MYMSHYTENEVRYRDMRMSGSQSIEYTSIFIEGAVN